MDDNEYGPISNYWRLCDELSVMQAALLVVGCDPASTASQCEKWQSHERPYGYEAAKHAISNALRRKTIVGKHHGLPDTDFNGREFGEIADTTDLDLSRVDRDSLVAWLEGRGFTEGFFFPPAPAQAATPYLDRTNPRYAPKLAAAVLAWTAVTDPGKLHPKKALDKWLREHAAEFGLSDEDGKPNEQGIEETSKVANWQQQGGAGKTPG